MTRPDDNDQLIRRYREASAQDARRPSAHVREAVRAHAEMISTSKAASPAPSPALAANQSRWKLSLLASVALAGLTGLLVLQFDRGTPHEQEAALGRPAPVPALTAPTAPPSPAAADAAVARSEVPAVRPMTPAPSPKTVARPAKSAPEAGLTAPSPPPAAQQATAPAHERTVDATREQASEKAMVSPEPQATARAAPAAPALRMPAPAPAQESLAALAPRNAAALAAALHRTARAGQVAEAEALLQQGAALNAPDGGGRTALVLAVIHGHSELVRRLLALGANPALADREGLDALQHARRLGRDDMVRMIETRL